MTTPTIRMFEQFAQDMDECAAKWRALSERYPLSTCIAQDRDGRVAWELLGSSNIMLAQMGSSGRPMILAGRIERETVDGARLFTCAPGYVLTVGGVELRTVLAADYFAEQAAGCDHTAQEFRKMAAEQEPQA